MSLTTKSGQNPSTGYESPCGVMSNFDGWVRSSRGCYESPCGVMRGCRIIPPQSVGALRIPMRGYENSDTFENADFDFVTNPHAGL